MNNKLQNIRNGQLNKYDEIIKYLKQDNGYWLNNDKWDITKDFFMKELVHNSKYINFERFNNVFLKNELKYYIVFNFKERKLTNKYIVSLGETFKHLSNFLNENYYNINSFNEVTYEKFYRRWVLFLSEMGIAIKNKKIKGYKIINILFVIKFIEQFYDDREEIEKDVWYAKNIKGVKLAATQSNRANRLNFTTIPKYYRETVKRYFLTIITKNLFLFVLIF